MATIRYVGKNGQAPKPSALERKKETHQEILNEISAIRLKKLRGELVDKREVEFVVSNAIITLRAQLLRLPLLVVAELRELSHDQLHAIRMRTERAVHAFLEETSAALSKAVDPRSAIAELGENDRTANSLAQSKTRWLESGLPLTRSGARKEEKRKQHDPVSEQGGARSLRAFSSARGDYPAKLGNCQTRCQAPQH
jgi:hypothetical protein